MCGRVGRDTERDWVPGMVRAGDRLVTGRRKEGSQLQATMAGISSEGLVVRRPHYVYYLSYSPPEFKEADVIVSTL